MELTTRNNKWLEEKMYFLWENYFADVPRKNLVLIKFGRSSARQLGSIKWADKSTRIKGLLKRKEIKRLHEIQDDKRISVITITSKFKNPLVPEYVILSTIAHEMCHYTHGFNSPEKKLFRHPHKGGVIRKEMLMRDLGSIYKDSKRWLRENWAKLVIADLV